jgi:hypothetical protein
MTALVFKSLAQQDESGLEIDAGKRFTLWFGDPRYRPERIARTTMLYVRWVGKENLKLLSLDLDSQTGVLFCCDLILYTRSLGEPCVKDQNVRTEIGMPLFDLTHLPSSTRLPRTVDLKQEFGLENSGKRIRLSLLDGELTYKVRCQKTSFGFDQQNRLILIETLLDDGQTLSL